MFRLLVPYGLAVALAGCTSASTSTNTLQYADQAPTFPSNYEVEAARLVQQRDADPGFVRISKPRLTSGATAFSSSQWYVCVRGIPAPAPEQDFIAEMARMVSGAPAAASTARAYDVVLLFSEGQQPAVQEGFELAMCKDAEFEFINPNRVDVGAIRARPTGGGLPYELS
jgi:hypothetical protein